MTKNEIAINTLDAMKKQFLGETRDVLDMAIQALEENQQYRAIGTVKEFEALKNKASWIVETKAYLEKCASIFRMHMAKHSHCAVSDISYCPFCGDKLMS